MAKRRIPKYRRFKPKDLGLVVIEGRQHYLGKYGTPGSIAEYNRLIQEWLARDPVGIADLGRPTRDFTIGELILRFWEGFAEGHYRRSDGTPTGELDNYRDSLRPLRRLYGATRALEFGPLALKAVRQSMVDDGLARSTINQRIGRIVRLFKWAVAEELLPPQVHQALSTVPGLQRGRTPAREPDPVGPAPEADILAVKTFVSRQVWAMVEVQLLTGMRPGEVCRMRGIDVDRSRPVWVYAPPVHKTAHRGKRRQVYLGPRAQALLAPWWRSVPDEYLFSPREAVEERRGHRQVEDGARRADRDAASPTKSGGRPPGERYTPQTYHHAIQRSCARAGVAPWHPHQLRHNAATRLRHVYGLEATRAILGHESVATTEIYAEADQAKAFSIMGAVG